MAGTAPPEVVARARAMRDLWMDQLEDAIDEMASDMSAVARRSIAMVKEGNYSAAAVRRATDYALSRGDRVMGRYLADQIREGADAADRVDRVYRAWDTAGMGTPSAVVTAAEAAGAIEGAGVSAQAAVDLEATKPLAGAVVRVPAGMPKGAAELLPSRQVRLSGKLHRAADMQKIRSGVSAAVREGRALEKTARDLIAGAPKLGAGQSLPQGLERVVKAAKSLDPKAFKRAVAAVEKYAQRIVDPATGTRALKDARGGYAEALQILKRGGPEATDKAMERWLDEKQRYNADRIVRTEAAASYRAREGQQIKKNDRIVGLIWRLSKGARKGYVSRTKVPKRGKSAGRRCICEAMADQTFPKEVLEEYPRGGHPHCMCFFERVYASGDIEETAFADGEEE